ncbi:hypothetical protein K432DRAFT_393960 [Lepidopterella palustris CBS 459.81]|uniref:Mitochondrial outer membrane protein n=1 Tax=Lepidopterella palustris CBS 459.81 TaxID=1314670 RepID=A0A8E2E8H5_9PEZI|nr:hypothetical protein K432DRAFT_393960 [Lepidopterella palustris CBS 459.81]
MPSEEIEPGDNAQNATTPQPRRSFFTVPPPIKRLFDKFPLLTYPANELPLRAPRNRHQHALYIFTTTAGATKGAPSYNPSCLKWQTYLKFSQLEFRVVSSNNHASPSGALPFLLPSSPDISKPLEPVSSDKLQKWALNNGGAAVEEPSDLRYEAYLSLLDHRIRRAWLYSLYLTSNFTSIAESLYVLPTSSNSLVRLAIAYELRAAAEAELLKHSTIVNAESLYEDAKEAFGALETVLGDDEWFFGAEKPGLFDASVFAYTHLLLDDGLGKGWAESRLQNIVMQRGKLVAHRGRILAAYYPSA